MPQQVSYSSGGAHYTRGGVFYLTRIHTPQQPLAVVAEIQEPDDVDAGQGRYPAGIDIEAARGLVPPTTAPMESHSFVSGNAS